MQPLSALFANGLTALEKKFWASPGTTTVDLREQNEDMAVPLPEVPSSLEVSPEQTTSFLAKEISSLSCRDREKVYSDVHCVSGSVQESPQFLHQKLLQMEKESNQLWSKPAYDLALAANPDYVMNDEFRLRFLRADLYDPRLAALRLARHFEVKLELFGPSKLVKDIVQDDLDEESMEAVCSGFSQFLPKTDRAGRRVSVVFPHPASLSSLSKRRGSFYLGMAQSSDEDVQRKGIVAIVYTIGQRASHDVDCAYIWKVAQLNRSLPLRLEALHFFHDSTTWAMSFSLAKLSIGRFTRLRLRDHRVGCHQETLDILQSFGIPTDEEVFPVTEDGHYATKNHLAALEALRTKERLQSTALPHHHRHPSSLDHLSMSSSSEDDAHVGLLLRVGQPAPNDVLLGRGKAIYKHKGNVQFRHFVEQRRDEYDKAITLAQKKQISAEIVEAVKERTGHFLLKESSLGWVEVDDYAARKKVGHTFRTMRGSRKHHGDHQRAIIPSEHECEGQGKRALAVADGESADKKTRLG